MCPGGMILEESQETMDGKQQNIWIKIKKGNSSK
jgi:hypothetical protein